MDLIHHAMMYEKQKVEFSDEAAILKWQIEFVG